jgi:cytochrome c biogenesis protein CcmG/thiol:disulfide interchange protein DsbE
MHKKNIILILSILLAIAGLVLYQAKSLDNRFASFQESQKSGTVITKYPKVSFQTIDKKSNYDFYSTDFSKNDLFVHFWATWCGPCEAEFPKLEKLVQEAKSKNIKFLFVAVNDKVKDIKKFLKRFPNLDVQIVVDQDFIHQSHFGTYKLPETFLFDKNSQIIKKFTGAKNWTLSMLNTSK